MALELGEGAILAHALLRVETRALRGVDVCRPLCRERGGDIF